MGDSKIVPVLTFPNSSDGIIDTTCRTICKTIEQYQYLYEISAQLSRLAYCDSGIIKKVFEDNFGADNDSVNTAIDKYDNIYSLSKKGPLREQKASSVIQDIPHESYALGPTPNEQE